MVSIEDVANKAKVSVSTVSFVLNGRAHEMRISEKTVTRVLEATQELGYIPNLAAKKLSRGGGSTLPEIALFWTPSQNSTFLTVFISEAQALFDGGRARDMRFIVEPFRMGQLWKLESILKRGHYNGIIVPPVSQADITYINSLDMNVPVVMLHGETDKYSMIAVDNYQSGRTAAMVFAAKGLKKVALINNRSYAEEINESSRSKGFLDACSELGMESEVIEARNLKKPEYIYYNKIVGRGTAAAEEILKRKVLPEGIFIQNDNLAAVFMNTVTRAGVRVPEDMEIIAYGSDFLPETCRPTMTSIRFPTAEITRETVMLMSKLLVNPRALPEKKLITTRVIFRESCPRPEGF